MASFLTDGYRTDQAGLSTVSLEIPSAHVMIQVAGLHDDSFGKEENRKWERVVANMYPIPQGGSHLVSVGGYPYMKQTLSSFASACPSNNGNDVDV